MGTIPTMSTSPPLPPILPTTVKRKPEEHDAPVFVQLVLISSPQRAGSSTHVSCRRMLEIVKKVGSVTIPKATARRHVANAQKVNVHVSESLQKVYLCYDQGSG